MVNLQIEESLGVHGVQEETRKLAQAAGNFPKGRVLDMGTGTGYIGIYLAKKGFQVDATDINLKAIELARRNADLNRVTLNLFHSSLFDKVQNCYDLIVFNPPLNPGEGRIYRFFGSLICKYDKLVLLALPFVTRIFGWERCQLIRKFLGNAENFLNRGGTLILHLLDHEIRDIEQSFEKISLKRLDSVDYTPDSNVVSIQFREKIPR